MITEEQFMVLMNEGAFSEMMMRGDSKEQMIAEAEKAISDPTNNGFGQMCRSSLGRR